MIRVLMVDDSPLALHVMQRLLARAPDIRVVGTAANGQEALPMVPALDPNVICLDLNMPVMSGLDFTRRVMATHPRPILVVSVAVEPGTPGVFALLQAGAVDVLPKPGNLLADEGRLATELISKIRLVAGVKVFRRGQPPAPPPSRAEAIQPPGPSRLVAMGASTGGPEAYRQILAALPAGFPLPVVCVQHIGAEFLREMVGWLDSATSLQVRQAAAGEVPEAGKVYFAPPERHLDFDVSGRFVLSAGPPVDGHRPSATVTLAGAARQFGRSAVGVLLTGMGRDGAAGLASIARVGGTTIAQDEASSVVYGMPGAAVALGAAQHVLPLGEISLALAALAGGTRKVART